MKAVVHDRYGPPEVLRVDELDRPAPKEDEVLVRVHASTVTRGEAIGVRHAEYRFLEDGEAAAIVVYNISRPTSVGRGLPWPGRGSTAKSRIRSRCSSSRQLL